MKPRRWRAWGALALGALALVAGAGFGAPALAPLGIGLMAAPVLAFVVVEVVRRGCVVTRVIEPVSLVAGEGALVRVVLRGGPVRTGLVRLLERSADLGVPAAAGPAAPAGRRSHAGGRAETAWRVAPAQRGEHVLSPPRVVFRDPFGLVERAVVGRGKAASLVVVPRTVTVGIALGAGDDDGASVGRGRRRLTAGLDLDGIRDYLAGDPLSRVHWGQTARRGTLQTKDMHAPSSGGRPTVVLLDCHASTVRDTEVFETSVVAAASLVRHLVAAGRSVTLVHTGSGLRPAPSARWDDMERVLARVVADGNTPVSGALDGLCAQRPAPAAVLLVTGIADPDLSRAIRRAGAAGVQVGCVLCGAAAAIAPDAEAAGSSVHVAADVPGLAATLGGSRHAVG